MTIATQKTGLGVRLPEGHTKTRARELGSHDDSHTKTGLGVRLPEGHTKTKARELGSDDESHTKH